MVDDGIVVFTESGAPPGARPAASPPGMVSDDRAVSNLPVGVVHLESPTVVTRPVSSEEAIVEVGIEYAAAIPPGDIALDPAAEQHAPPGAASVIRRGVALDERVVGRTPEEPLAVVVENDAV